MTLLDINISSIYLLTIGLGVVIGAMGWLLRNMYQENKDKLIKQEDRLIKQADEIERLKTSVQDEIRKLEKSVNDLNINILDKLDDIKNKFYEFRKQS